MPTASYTTQLLGNPSGGQSRGFTYSGTCKPRYSGTSTSSWEFPAFRSTLARVGLPGRTFLPTMLENIFPVQSAYTAPSNGTNNLTLGELYLQQQLFNNALTIAAGRLTPQRTFATMPVLNQYINGYSQEGQVFSFPGRGQLLDLLNSPSSSRRLNICRLAIGTLGVLSSSVSSIKPARSCCLRYSFSPSPAAPFRRYAGRRSFVGSSRIPPTF